MIKRIGFVTVLQLIVSTLMILTMWLLPLELSLRIKLVIAFIIIEVVIIIGTIYDLIIHTRKR
ncbi:hypothetical protein [Lapidilactobacillus bayanensis]|uniref:hypothetical protein n=1 Tax=Lapidilactobacillus bayanensis TaxID=2485998 RepID=UPI000F78D801|nr:hypothetical protein [Lapidilactobacillus bayanensis]